MSFFTHSPQVFLPLHFTTATSTFLQADTQSSTLLRFRCLNHLNLPHHTSHTLNTQKTVQILAFYLSTTLHIHIVITHFTLSRLCRFSAFFLCPCFSSVCQYTLGHKLCISFPLYDTSLVARAFTTLKYYMYSRTPGTSPGTPKIFNLSTTCPGESSTYLQSFCPVS